MRAHTHTHIWIYVRRLFRARSLRAQSYRSIIADNNGTKTIVCITLCFNARTFTRRKYVLPKLPGRLDLKKKTKHKNRKIVSYNSSARAIDCVPSKTIIIISHCCRQTVDTRRNTWNPNVSDTPVGNVHYASVYDGRWIESVRQNCPSKVERTGVFHRSKEKNKRHDLCSPVKRYTTTVCFSSPVLLTCPPGSVCSATPPLSHWDQKQSFSSEMSSPRGGIQPTATDVLCTEQMVIIFGKTDFTDWTADCVRKMLPLFYTDFFFQKVHSHKSV